MNDPVQAFFADFSTETTPVGASRIDNFGTILRPGTKVFIACLPGTFHADVISLAARLRREGMTPVPHIAARTIPDRAFLDSFLNHLVRDAAVDEVLCIAGSAAKPAGLFSSSMDILQTGLFEKNGIRRINVAGHPEGSPDFPDSAAMDALAWKNEFATKTGADVQLVTQFCFESAPIIKWYNQIHAAGNRLPVRVGIPGIASLKTLLAYAKSCGIGPSSNFLLKQARHVTKLLNLSAPDQMIVDLSRFRLATPKCGIVGCHMYPFGGLAKTAAWSYAIADGRTVLGLAAS